MKTDYLFIATDFAGATVCSAYTDDRPSSNAATKSRLYRPRQASRFRLEQLAARPNTTRVGIGPYGPTVRIYREVGR